MVINHVLTGMILQVGNPDDLARRIFLWFFPKVYHGNPKRPTPCNAMPRNFAGRKGIRK